MSNLPAGCTDADIDANCAESDHPPAWRRCRGDCNDCSDWLECACEPYQPDEEKETK